MKNTEKHHFQQVDVNSVPRSAQVATLMRAQLCEGFDGLDIALAGVPFDGGSSFRAGARHGPAQNLARCWSMCKAPRGSPFPDRKLLRRVNYPRGSLRPVHGADRRTEQHLSST